MAHDDRLKVIYAAEAGEVAIFAAQELARSLSVMTGEEVAAAAESAAAATSGGLSGPYLRLERGRADRGVPAPTANVELRAGRDGFALRRETVPSRGGVEGGALVLRGGTERALLHGGCYLLERLGGVFPVIGPPRLPRIAVSAMDRLEDVSLEPAFLRRAFTADIMTWHYADPERLAFHLEHDNAFIPWMAARGINRFAYIRHAVDSRLRIDELAAVYRKWGIGAEYGGHVLPLLLAREHFVKEPEFFTADAAGVRNPKGNLCVANAGAIAEVCAGAVRYVRENPEGELLHIWGADVRQGAWCGCSQCAELMPQQQYMKVVNAIAGVFATEGIDECPVAYLAYHDTLEPGPGWRPLPNVHCEWAPRERCYSHAIDDRGCAVNPRYHESLKRNIELFDGRVHVFEYYADAILFGGLGVAMPSVVAGDLRAYRALGLESVSCLTFGAYSTLAYPVNLESFARGTRSPDFEPDAMMAATAEQLHPQCAPEMAEAYRAIAEASAVILDNGGDVMSPKDGRGVAGMRSARREALFATMDRAVAAAEYLGDSGGDAVAAGERALWRYNRRAVSGILEYLEALGAASSDRVRLGETALAQIDSAIEAIQGMQSSLKGTWGTYDIEWTRAIWLERMRRRLREPSV